MNNSEKAFLLNDLQDELGDKVLSYDFDRGQLTVTVPRDSICQILQIMRDHSDFMFETLMDLTAVDYPERENRFDVIYNLLSLSQNHRLRIRIHANENEPVPSVSSIYKSATWYEREVWDMFGIFFSNNTDLRRILTDYGFEGHPLRKDFPLTGHVEVRYDEESERVVYESVKLTQDFRTFDFVSPWEGISDIQDQDILPGDEKASSQPEKAKFAPEYGWKSYKKEAE